MPIYAYRCEDCGFAKDVLQKMSDDVLTICPDCGHPSFKKQITAAGFQLKGSGWYVTDFKEGNKPAAKTAENKANAINNETANSKATAAATATESKTNKDKGSDNGSSTAKATTTDASNSTTKSTPTTTN